MNRENYILKTVSLFLYLFLFSLFLTLGNEFKDQTAFRVLFGAVPLLIFYAGLSWREGLRPYASWSLAAFFFFLLFELLRGGYGFVMLQRFPQDPSGVLWRQYTQGALNWFYCFSFFLMSYFLHSQRRSCIALFNVAAWAAFFVAISGIPGLMLHKQVNWHGYLLGPKDYGYFFPLFYAHEWVPRFLLSKSYHPNFVGDIIAAGFFPLLGLFAYGLMKAAKGQSGNSSKSALTAHLLLQATMLLVMAAGILLLFSRGTIAFYFIALFIYFIFILSKKPSVKKVASAAAVFAVSLIFLFWAGNFQEAVKEVSTLEKEQAVLAGKDTAKHGSISYNLEGMKRSMKMYHEHPVLGVGTKGYKLWSEHYADKASWKKYVVIRFAALSHYGQTLAEEGAGAWIYFAFLILWVIEMIKGILTTKSRFVFASAAAILCLAIMILGHGSINHILQRFPMPLLLYILMGAGLAMVRKNFDSQSES